jgi:hypothetical protein
LPDIDLPGLSGSAFDLLPDLITMAITNAQNRKDAVF